MDEQTTSGPAKRAQAHYIWTPDLKIGKFCVIRFLVIAVFGPLLAHLPLKTVSTFIFDRQDDQVLFASLCEGMLYTSAVAALAIRRHNRLLASPRFRTERLNRIRSHPKAKPRFPHRIIESAFRWKFGEHASYIKLIHKLSPNHMVLVNSPKHRVNHELLFDQHAFEPIQMDDGDAIRHAMRLDKDVEETNASRSRKQFLSTATGFVGIVFFAFLAIAELQTGNLRTGTLLLGVVAVVIALYCLLPLYIENRFWIFTGGIAHRYVRLWPKTERLEIFRTDNATLALECREGRGFLIRHDGTIPFQFPKSCADALLAAWLSTARTPTDQGIRSFLGISDHDRA